MYVLCIFHAVNSTLQNLGKISNFKDIHRRGFIGKRTINLFNDLPEVDLDRDATAQRLNVIQLMWW